MINFLRCAESIKKQIDDASHGVLFLPAYSPFLNPIENLFNQLKFYVKQANPATVDEVFVALERASERVTAENCANYFRNMSTYLTRCLNKEYIAN